MTHGPTAEAVVARLAAEDPVYDYMTCFFCDALAPGDTTGCDPSLRPEGDDHEDDCPWWMARQILGLTAWPTAAEQQQSR